MSTEGYGPDLRLYIGWMFLVLSFILCGYGLVEPRARAPFTNLNINFLWGVVLFLFGAVMLALGYRAQRRERRAAARKQSAGTAAAQ